MEKRKEGRNEEEKMRKKAKQMETERRGPWGLLWRQQETLNPHLWGIIFTVNKHKYRGYEFWRPAQKSISCCWFQTNPKLSNCWCSKIELNVHHYLWNIILGHQKKKINHMCMVCLTQQCKNVWHFSISHYWANKNGTFVQPHMCSNEWINKTRSPSTKWSEQLKTKQTKNR